MEALWILLAGVAIVIGGVLLLRMHAFLALTLAAMAVGMLTPQWQVERYETEKAGVAVVALTPEKRTDLGLAAGEVLLKVGPKQGVRPGMRYVVLREQAESTVPAEVAELEIVRFVAVPGKHKEDKPQERAVASPASAASEFSLQQGDIIIDPLARVAALDAARQTVGERVATGFGKTAKEIGILIAMAAIIGKCLLDSGSADRIVRSALRLFGERGAPGAFLSSGFLLGIPVFFDTVFYLMIPLGKAMRLRTGRNYLLYALSIVAGATMAHSLVPPTPGPLLVAQQLDVDIGLMILAGSTVGLVASAFGYLWASLANRRWELPLRETADVSLKELQEVAQRDDSGLPPLWLALLPILLPVVLIGGNEILKSLTWKLPSSVAPAVVALGNKNVALILAAGIALVTLIWQKRTSLKALGPSIESALASGGSIILITGAGGAFGGTIQQTGVANLIRDLPTGSPQMVLVLAFLITMAVRTAQGSATVAMITAVGILAGLADAEKLGFHPVYIALAIGCGSKPLAWMNDSGFWVICKMSGMTEGEGLRFVTPMSLIMGVVGLGATMLGAWLWPLAAG